MTTRRTTKKKSKRRGMAAGTPGKFVVASRTGIDLIKRFDRVNDAAKYALRLMNIPPTRRSARIEVSVVEERGIGKLLVVVPRKGPAGMLVWNVDLSYIDGIRATPHREVEYDDDMRTLPNVTARHSGGGRQQASGARVDTRVFGARAEEARRAAAARFAHDDVITDEDMRTIPMSGRTLFEKPHRSGDKYPGTARGSSDPLRRLEQEGSFVDGKKGHAAGGASKYVVRLYDQGGAVLQTHVRKTAGAARALELRLSEDYAGLGAFALTEPDV